MERIVCDVITGLKKVVLQDFCAKRICCSNIFLFQGMKLHWREETGKSLVTN